MPKASFSRETTVEHTTFPGYTLPGQYFFKTRSKIGFVQDPVSIYAHATWIRWPATSLGTDPKTRWRTPDNDGTANRSWYPTQSREKKSPRMRNAGPMRMLDEVEFLQNVLSVRNQRFPAGRGPSQTGLKTISAHTPLGSSGLQRPSGPIHKLGGARQIMTALRSTVGIPPKVRVRRSHQACETRGLC